MLLTDSFKEKRIIGKKLGWEQLNGLLEAKWKSPKNEQKK